MEERRGHLDPEDWNAFRDTCHQVVEEMVDRFRNSSSGPVWREIPDRVTRAFQEGLPGKGRPIPQLLTQVREDLLPYTLGNAHPRFYGWVNGAGTPVGALAEFLSGSMNANLGGRHHAPILVEEQVVSWMRDLFGFPKGSSGTLLSGTSMATVTGLAVARHWITAGTDRTAGLRGGEPLVGYASEEGHHSIRDAFSLLGLGGHALRGVGLATDGSMDPARLEARIRDDLCDGRRPFVVVATAGSVTCGAIDDLRRIREICHRYGLWLHVDGAFGAAAILAPEIAPRLAGIDTADSLAMDFHKWFHVPYDAGCVLVRDGALHRSAFGGRPDYLTSLPAGPASGDRWPMDLGPEMSRGFRAFKVWFSLQALGSRAVGEAVARNCAQARSLADRVDREPGLERLAPADLNIVCFRYAPEGLDEEHRNDVNRRILLELHTRGLAVPSPIRRGERLGIRVCLCNHRTSHEDLEALVDHVLELARGYCPTAGVC